MVTFGFPVAGFPDATRPKLEMVYEDWNHNSRTMPTSSEVLVRSYKDGDEHEISRIFEKCYSSHAGYVRRTPKFWEWFNLLRPEVSKECVLVATVDGTIVGCLTLGSDGEILDPCYDPDFDGNYILGSLLESAESIARDQGLERITANVPSDDPQMTTACKGLNMRRRELDRTFSISISDYRRFLLALLERSNPPKGSYLLILQFANGKTGKYLLVISDDGISVEGEGPAQIRIRVTEGTLNGLVFKGSIPLGNWFARRITFYPPWRARKVLELLRSLSLGSKWFVPRGGTL